MTGNISNTVPRDYIFDVMKGLGIILMVLGHTIGPESPLHNYIYAFHMPLFFIISGYFVKEKGHLENIRLLYNRLIKPFLFIAVCVVVLKTAQHYHNTHEFYIDIEKVIYGVGPGWFLLAMFWGRILFNALIHLPASKYLTFTLLISSIPTFLQWTDLFLNIPFNVMQGLSCTVFIAIGHYARQRNILQLMYQHVWTWIIISLLLCLNTGYYGEIEMSGSYFKLWIIDYAGAIGGTFLCYCIAKAIVKQAKTLTGILTKISIFSLAIFSIHAIDFCVFFWYHITVFISQEYVVAAVLFMRLALFYPIILVTSHIPFFYHLFVGKTKPEKMLHPSKQN